MLLRVNNGKFYLAKSHTVKGVTIPRGMYTDGISGNLIVSRLLGKYNPKYLEAVVLHDYLCNMELYELADDKFEAVLNEIDMSPLKRSAMTLAVRVYHRIKYGV